LRTWWASPGDRAAVAVEAAGGSVVGQVDGPQDAGGALGDRPPGGTALQAPPAVVAKMGDLLLPTPLKWRVFFARQERNPAYLKAGDVVTASIASEDGALDLGSQRTRVRDAAG
jgi:hypothetical protein